MSLLFYLATVTEGAESTTASSEMIWVLFLVTTLLAIFHLVSYPLYKLFDGAEHIVHSFSGGLAISYVFVHLLPELEKAGDVFGESIYLITLLGFIVFYGIQSFVSQQSHKDKAFSSRIFFIEIAFAGIYNALIIYTLPDYFKGLFLLVYLYIMVMGLHLLSRNYGLYKKYGNHFKILGSSILAASLFIGLAMNTYIEPGFDEVLSDIMTAFLTGFILLNVFAEELPEAKTTTFIWFLAGISSYIIFMAVGG